MKAKKLIEVAMPIKEISAESVRDNRLAGGNIRTLHIWWARRPLPTCRAVIFASLVPDPLDAYCPQAFKDAVDDILMKDKAYEPYPDIPYTAVYDPMEDNARNRLMLFIGKFSPLCQRNMLAGKKTAPADQLTEGSLIKWENHNNPEVLEKAQRLIWIAYNSDLHPELSYNSLSSSFDKYLNAIHKAESGLYCIVDRDKESEEVKKAQAELGDAIKSFQDRMPAVFDPFAGGGAIPLEAARLGCRSYGNDINPVAHIIEKGSAELPQKYGKQVIMSRAEFENKYGKDGNQILQEISGVLFADKVITIPNKLSFDVSYYAKRIIASSFKEIGQYYPKDDFGNTVTAYYWARNAICSNPSCRARVPMLRNFYLCNTANNQVYLSPNINGTDIKFSLVKGKYSTSQLPEWNHHGNITCPCCGSVTDVKSIKAQSREFGLSPVFYGIISETENGRIYSTPSGRISSIINQQPKDVIGPEEDMPQNDTQNVKVPFWGFIKWRDLFSPRQLRAIQTFVKYFNEVKEELPKSEYNDAVITYLAIWIDRIALFNTMFSRWNDTSEKIQHLFGRQAISMLFDFVESNPFCSSSGSASNQLDWVIRYINSESFSPFPASFANSSSGDKLGHLQTSVA